MSLSHAGKEDLTEDKHRPVVNLVVDPIIDPVIDPVVDNERRPVDDDWRHPVLDDERCPVDNDERGPILEESTCQHKRREPTPRGRAVAMFVHLDLPLLTSGCLLADASDQSLAITYCSLHF